MKIANLALFVILVTGLGWAYSQTVVPPIAVTPQGEYPGSRSCRDWLRHHEADTYAARIENAWVIGFVHGASLTIAVWKNVDITSGSPDQIAYITNWCRSEPDQNNVILAAALDLVGDMAKRFDMPKIQDRLR